MGLHSIVEPAGTLQTGWKLTDKDPDNVDIRNKDAAEPVPEPDPETHSKWESSEWKLGEVG